MTFEEKTLVLKDGRACILRPAHGKDGAAMLACFRAVSAETPFLLRYEDEITFTLQEEEQLLEEMKDHPQAFMMLAEVDGVLAGNCALMPKGGMRRVAHRCDFSVALRKEWWGLGVGSALLEYALFLAGRLGYEQVELEVVDGNHRARRLYERFGFRETGKNLRALKYDDGSYADESKMIKFLI